MKKLPKNLSPLICDHPASSAYRITGSSCEWTWNQAEQEAMARALVQLDGLRMVLRDAISARIDELIEAKKTPSGNKPFDSGYNLLAYNEIDFLKRLRSNL